MVKIGSLMKHCYYCCCCCCYCCCCHCCCCYCYCWSQIGSATAEILLALSLWWMVVGGGCWWWMCKVIFVLGYVRLIWVVVVTELELWQLHIVQNTSFQGMFWQCMRFFILFLTTSLSGCFHKDSPRKFKISKFQIAK